MTDAAFLIDSNVAIYIFADAGCPAARRVGDCEPGSVVTSAVAYAEIMRGLAGGPEEALLKADAFFRLIPVLPFDEKAARAYSLMPFKRGSYDRLIAAHAFSLGLTLITNNVADFVGVPDLRVENWTQ